MFRTLTIERKVLELTVRIVCVESWEEYALYIHLLKKDYELSINRTNVVYGGNPFPKPPTDVLWKRRVCEMFQWMADVYGAFYSTRYTFKFNECCKRSEVKDAEDAFKQALEKAFPKNVFKASNWQKVK